MKALVYGYPHSDGSLLSNYIRFVAHQHPLLSIFFCNSKHPYSRQKRLIVLFCVLCFAFMVEIALLDNFYYENVIFLLHFDFNYDLFLVSSLKYKVCREGCHNVNGICTGGENDGMARGRM
jgi:hypothetical protein